MAKLKDTEINGNLVVTGDLLNKDGVDLTTAFSNPNLLINSDFRNPVNQRGQTTYTRGSADTYTIDRWMINYNTIVNVLDDCIEMVGNVANNNRFYQRFENPISGTITITVYVKEITGGIVGVQTLDDNSFVTQMGLNQGLNTITADVSNMSAIHFTMFKTGATIQIEWIKVEYGSLATPFVPRSYGEELLLCQRYYQVINKLYLYPSSYSNSISYFNGCLLPVPMRTTPTKTFEQGTAILYNERLISYFKFEGQATDGMYFNGILDAEIY